MLTADIQIIMPELLLMLFAVLGWIFGAVSDKEEAGGLLTWATAGAFILLAAWIGINDAGLGTAFDGFVVNDGFARFAKLLILVVAALILLMSDTYMQRRGLLTPKYPVFVAFSVVGMMVMVSAGDLITVFLGSEMLAVSLYVLVFIRRDGVAAFRAHRLFVLLGLLSTVLLLLGVAILYGQAGTSSFGGLSSAVSSDASTSLLIGVVFLLAGLACKIAVAPFHMWAPEIYAATPTPITALFATLPIAAGMLLLLRVFMLAFGSLVEEWHLLVAVLALASMFVGALAATGQTDIKRLLAFTSIAHVGFALMGLAAGTELGAQAVLSYMVIFAVTNLGIFAVVLLIEKDHQPVTDILSLRRFSETHPLLALVMAALLLSHAGLPPLVGFFGKFYLLQAAFDAGLVWLAVSACFAMVIAAFPYIRIVGLMYFGGKKGALESTPTPILWLTAVACGGLLAVAWLPGINLFGIEPATAAAAASLVN